MNAGQKIDRDDALETLTNKLASTIATLSTLQATVDVILDGSKVGKSVVRLLYSEMNS